MCLYGRHDVDIDVVLAYKIFSVEDGRLQSAFLSVDNTDPDTGKTMYYVAEKVIKVVPEHRTFFAFQKYQDAILCCKQGTWFWNFRSYSKDLVVLPVILSKVVASGYICNRDINDRMNAYEAKEIIVRDSVDLRMKSMKDVELLSF